MNRDWEDLQRSLLRLVQDDSPDAPKADRDEGSDPPGMEGSDLSILQGGKPTSSGPHSPEAHSQQTYQLNLGETPAVQDRYYALLKRRLETEIQQNPPLFPWETTIHDYEAESVNYGAVSSGVASGLPTSVTEAKVPALLWLSQLKNLTLPVQVPDAILAQLFERCQAVVQSSLQEGAKLVRAVEDLFPGEAQMLNHLAGFVITSPARSSGPTALVADASYPSHYETAAPAQQMLLSLLAVREMLAALTLTVSPSRPLAEQQWATELGLLTLQAAYESAPATPMLRIQGTLPGGGELVLQGDGQQATAQRPDAGILRVELMGPSLNHTYTLQVQLADQPAAPLVFTIRTAEI